MNDNDLEAFVKRADRRKDSTRKWQGERAIEQVGTELDATINFRVNSKLKHEFDHLCRINHSTMAREIKKFMTEAIAQQRLL